MPTLRGVVESDEKRSREELLAELTRLRAREQGVLRALGEVAGSTSLIAHELKNAASAAHLALRAAAGSLGVNEEEALADLVARLRNVESGVRRALGYAVPLDPQPEECEPESLFAEALEARRAPFEEAGTQLETAVEGNPRLRADRRHLVEALGELLDNARNAAPGGRVRASAHASGDRVVLAVEDDGPGFSEEARAHLFEPFAAGQPDGSGTGLALCRRLVEASDGTVEVTSSDLGGARVQLSLPG